MTEHYMANPAICLPGLRLAHRKRLNGADLLRGMALPEPIIQGLLADKISANLEPPDFLNTAQQLQFSKNLQACFDDPAIGLTIGNSSSFADLGILGLTMISAPSLRQAIHVGVLYAHIGGTLLHIQCTERGNKLAMQVTAPQLEPQLQRYIIEEQLAAFVSYIREMLHRHSYSNSIFERISFSFPEPDYSDRYRDFFACPISFNEPKNECWISSQLLPLAVAYTNADSFARCSRLCQDALDTLQQKDAIILQLQSWLKSLPHVFPKLEEGAAHLDIGSRALRRRLEELGTNFTRLIAETKVDQAKFFLDKKDLSAQDISELLGYSEVTNFRRAFKSWTGMSPKDYRQKTANQTTLSPHTLP
jgi:AraC-like DNA-binding protein